MIGLYLSGMVALHLALTLLPVVAGVLVAVSYGVRDRIVLLLIGTGTLGVLGAATFWAYLCSASGGRWFAAAAVVGCALVIGWTVIRRRSRLSAQALGPLLPPTLFYAALVGFTTMMGYLRGGISADDMAGRNRYLPGLPVDSKLPLYLAQQLQDPARPLPHYLARPWQTSDRPPLQTGVYLFQQSVLGHDHFMHYQLVGIALQSLWVFGVWAFMVKTRLPAPATALALAVTASSGFIFVNTFFVWPKLFPAAYLMLVAAAVLSSDFVRYRRDPVAAAAIGVGIGCAMLGHPGSLFAVLGLGVALLVVRVWPSRRLLLVGGGAAALLYGPWIWFGQVYQPPGDFLMKYQLARTRNYLDPGSLQEALVAAYRQAGWHQVLSNKLQNVAAPFHDTLRYPREILVALHAQLAGQSAAGLTARNQAESSAFFHMIPALGFMALGPVLLLVQWIRLRVRQDTKPRPDYLRLGMLGIGCLVTSYLVWALMLFGPGTTTIQQGSYFLELGGFAVGVIGWYALAPRLCVALVVVQSVLAVWQYGIAVPLPTHFMPPGPVLPSTAIGAAVAFVAAVGALYLMWVAPGDPDQRLSEPSADEASAAAALPAIDTTQPILRSRS